MLESKLYEVIGDYHDETVIEFNQWTSIDRENLILCRESKPQFINLVIQKLEKPTAHSFNAKCQSNYLRECKDNLEENEVIILGDFAENYSFVVQDEVQGFHWNNLQCTLYPVIVYYKDGDALQSVKYGVMYDDNNHDVGMVYQVKKEIIIDLKLRFPYLSLVTYFSDGCAGQYKNCKHLYNLCHHKPDYNIDAKWVFFATSHGKQPCDGIGGTVKRLVSNASLQRINNSQILNPHDMIQYCKKTFKVINLFLSQKMS